MVVTGDAERVRALAGADEVVKVYRIIPKTPSNKGTDALTRTLEAWQSTGYTGKDVRIGIIDTGIDYTHAGFGGPGTQEAYDLAYGEKGRAPSQPAPSTTPSTSVATTSPGTTTTPPEPSGHLPGAHPDENPIDSLDTIGSGHGSHVAARPVATASRRTARRSTGTTRPSRTSPTGRSARAPRPSPVSTRSRSSAT
ncbi:hypothetical protein NKG05_17835 [Oerskovia sp. M15]